MFLLTLNKTGLGSMLITQLLCFSLCPAYGRPSLLEDHTVTDDDGKEDQEEVGDEDGPQGEDGIEDENDTTLGPVPDRDCEGKQGKDLDICTLLWLVEFKTHLKKVEKAYALKSKSGPGPPLKEKDDIEYDD